MSSIRKAITFLAVIVSICVFSYSPKASAGPSEDCAANSQGYWLLASDGGVFTYGDAPFYGSTGNLKLNSPIVGMTATTFGQGYWLVASDGGVFTYGDAPFYGSTGNLKLTAPIIGIRSTTLGGGYWLFASDGGVFAFGDASFFSTPYLNYYPFIKQQAFDGGSVVDTLNFTESDGYMFVSSLGQVATWGSVNYFGSYSGDYFNTSPYVEAVVTTNETATSGYWLARADGSVYSFGDSPFYGSAGNIKLQKPIVSMISELDYSGYRLIGADGGVFTYGASMFCGSTGNQRLNAPIIDATSAGFTKYL